MLAQSVPCDDVISATVQAVRVANRVEVTGNDEPEVKRGESVPELSVGWVDPRVGLGWVGSGSEIFVFSGLGWVMGLK